MNVKLISGKFGGRVLKTPGSDLTHPMSGRVKGSLFNIIGDEIINSTVLDAFAGSGSLGLEALSRGAKKVTFVDRDEKSISTIKGNVKELDVENLVEIYKMNVTSFIEMNIDKKYDVIITDPPYDDPQFSTVLRLAEILRPNGLMVLSYLGRGELPTANGIVVVDNRSYGEAALAFYRKK